MRTTKKPGASEGLRQAIDGLGKNQGRVGWFPASKYENGAPVAGVAYVQEFGSPSRGVPPRLGLRVLAEEKRPEWAKVAAQISKGVMSGQLPITAVAEAVGLAAEGNIRERVASVTEPPLKAATVEARKRRLANGGKGAQASIAKPLVDTGLLLNSVASEVVQK